MLNLQNMTDSGKDLKGKSLASGISSQVIIKRDDDLDGGDDLEGPVDLQISSGKKGDMNNMLNPDSADNSEEEGAYENEANSSPKQPPQIEVVGTPLGKVAAKEEQPSLVDQSEDETVRDSKRESAK